MVAQSGARSSASPGLAVVDPLVVPHRNNWNFAVLPDFQLTGFHVEDAHFDPVGVTVRDPQTGIARHVTVIGVLKDTASYAMGGILTSQDALAAFGDRVQPAIYYFKVAPGVSPTAAAHKLESAFLDHGVEADSIDKLLGDVMNQSRTFQQIVLGFLGLGLVVGVAALGVISARAVVERRQHIGVLRAIGFRRGMVQASFVLEASFLALTSILLGSALGLAVAFNVINDAASQRQLVRCPLRCAVADARRDLRRGVRGRGGNRLAPGPARVTHPTSQRPPLPVDATLIREQVHCPAGS